jgi:hypothetical protein
VEREFGWDRIVDSWLEALVERRSVKKDAYAKP